MKQIRFIPSGCQFWNKQIISCNGNSFAFCSTMAIYFLNFKDYQVDHIIACHEQNITSISWNIQNPKTLATCGSDGWLCVWDIEREKTEAKIYLDAIPLQIEYSPFESDIIAALLDTGELRIYDIPKNKKEKLVSIDGAKLIRWNNLTAGKLAIGGTDGKLYIHTVKKGKAQKIDLKKNSGIDDFQWDPNSANYILVSWKDGSMSLLDADEEKEMQTFDRQGAGINCIAWLKNVPGGFVTSNDRISAVKVWNVSNKSPLSTVKVGNTGLLNILTLSSTSFGKEGFLCTFKNGSVGVFNYDKKNLEFISQPNHSETIFDLSFNVKDKNVLATASYDGSIKIWQINEMKCLVNLHKPDLNVTQASNFKQHVIYGIAWSPKEPNKLLSVNSNGEIMLWETEKGKLLAELQPGSNSAIYRVDWNPIDPTQVASGSSDSICFIYNTDGKKLSISKKLKHPGTVFGVAWSPFSSEILATACQDGNVRVFDVSGPQEKVLNFLQGHTARVFNIAWNPTIPSVLASGSDDKSIKVWDIKKQNSCITLSGHTSNVRALVWNTELPWLLMSGSWDSTISMWDIREKKCIHVANEHHADVYGIACHPERPFVYVSCSRDTSVRFWTIERLVSPLLLRVVVSNDWTDILGQSPSGLGHEKEALRLCGAVSKRLCQEAESGQRYSIDYFQKIMDFFSYLDYQKEFWDIIRAVLKGKTEDITNRIMSLQNLPSSYLSRAQELESTGSSSGYTYDALNKKADRIMEAAKLYLKLGEFELYCEALIKLGKWEKALAFAPAVSYDYWKNLAKRHAEELENQESEETSSFYLLSGQTEKAIKFSMERNDYEDAKLIAALKMNDKFAQLESDDRYLAKIQKKGTIVLSSKNYNREELREIIQNLADAAIRQSQPLQAAGHHLTINDAHSAVVKLIRSNELIYAFAVCKLFNIPLLDEVSYLIARRAERYGEKNLGIILLKSLESKKNLEYYCAISPLNPKSIDELYSQNGLGSMNEYIQLGSKAETSGDLEEAIRYYILGKKDEKAAELAVDYTQKMFKNFAYNKIGYAIKLFEALFHGDLGTLSNIKLKLEVVGFSLYFGFKKAVWKGMAPMVRQFYKALKNFLKSRSSQVVLPIDINAVKFETLKFYAYLEPEKTINKLTKFYKTVGNDKLKEAMNNLMKSLTNSALKDSDLKRVERDLNRHRYYISGNNLPTHNNIDMLIKSCLSKAPVKAEGYAMEDNQSIFTLEEALMWANCCLVSPLQTGFTINPF